MSLLNIGLSNLALKIDEDTPDWLIDLFTWRVHNEGSEILNRVIRQSCSERG